MEINLIGGTSIKKIIIDGINNDQVIDGILKSNINGTYTIESVKKIELLELGMDEELPDKKVEVTFNGLPIEYWKGKVSERINDTFKRRGFAEYDIYFNRCYYHALSKRLYFELIYNFTRYSDKNDNFIFGIYNIISISSDHIIQGDYEFPCKCIFVPFN